MPSAQVQSIRDANRRRIVEAMRQGVRERAVTIPAKRGAGAYKRNVKHIHRIGD